MSQHQIHLRVFGGIELLGPDGRPVRSVLAQPKRLALLVYLAAAARGVHRRDTLFAVFWPEADVDHARSALNRAVYFLRQALGAEVIVTHGDEEVGVAPDLLRCDVAEFEAALAAGATERAVDLYRGDLAPGFLVSEAPAFEHWLAEERRRLRARAVDAAIELARSAAAGRGLERAERWAERAMALAPYDERAAVLRMTLLDQMGDRARALRVFEELQHCLRTELEVPPSPETLALAATIRGRDATRSESSPAGTLTTTVAERSPRRAAAAHSRSVRPLLPLLVTGLLALAGWLVAIQGRGRLPLPARWLQVTSEPGIEFEPALSPDGSEVAYVTRRQGRLVLAIQSATGEAASGVLLPALEVPGDHGLPAWSADGEFVRFTTITEGRPDAPWWEVGRLGGTPRRVALPRAGRWVAWSRDGERVAMVSGDSFLVTNRGESAARAFPMPDREMKPHSLAWSPDERWIAFVDQNPIWPFGRNTEGAALCLLDPRTGRVVHITDATHLNVSPAWLDAKTLLYISDRDGLRELYAIGVGPDGARGDPQKLPGGSDAHSITVSAEGHRLAVDRMEVRTGLYLYHLQRGHVSHLAEGRAVLTGNQVVESFDVSHDGTGLVFDSNRRGTADLYRARLDTTVEPVPLVVAPGDQFFPQFSPDGHEVVYYGDPSPTASLWLIPAEGGSPTRISDSTEGATNPRWAPDGRGVAYTSHQTGRVDVWLRTRTGAGGPWSAARPITNFGCYLAAWAPTGEGILCRTVDARAVVLTSVTGVERWRRDLTTLGFTRNPMVVASDSDLYFKGKRGPDEGIWAWPLSGRPPRLVLRADDPAFDLLGNPGSITVNHHRLVVTLGSMESDIWVTDLR
jgi:DNA-binding SARP family transcriptional activator/Tol biopolymer transport system component